MTNLTTETLEAAVALIERLRSGTVTDSELARIALQLDALLPDPNWFAYTIDLVPELTARQVVERAFSYRTVRL